MNGDTTLTPVASAPIDVATAVWQQPPRAGHWGDMTTFWIGRPFAAGWPVVWPAIFLLIFTAIFRWTNADTAISNLFYDRDIQQWTWFFHTGCTLFYRCGIYPAFVLFGIGIVMLHFGRVAKRWNVFRAGLFLIMLFVIGPGIIVNHGFKNHWGRPRPHQIQEFSGPHAFVPVGTPGTLQQNNSSFPSGHAAVAFYLIGPAFLASPRHRGLSTKMMLCGLIFGGGMALVRVMQGGHFMSDVVWSAAVVYFTAVILSAVILRPTAARSTASR